MASACPLLAQPTLSSLSTNSSPIPPGELPSFGTYWLESGLTGLGTPPLPFSPYPDAPIYALGDNQFLVDDSATNSGGGQRVLGMAQSDLELPPLPGGGSGDGGDGTNGVPYIYSFSTNGLWLEITGVTNGYADVNLRNATDSVYAILSKTDLSEPTWAIEQEVWPTNSAVMPFEAPEDGRTNLFLWAMDWTGVTENGNTTPDWWFFEYYGTVAFPNGYGSLTLADTNLDSVGNTLLSDYQNSLDPNIITFSISSTNSYVTSTSPIVNLDISTGLPFYYAVLVDSANFAVASWMPYTTTNITVPLGGVEGWHDVWVGLRGLPQSSPPEWQWTRQKLDLTPPAITISPPATTVSQNIIQLTGFTLESVSRISYNLDNVKGSFTNQQVLVLDRFLDTNDWDFSTNTIQAFDVELAPGTNHFTFNAADLAGNTFSTNFNVLLVSDSTPPALTLTWPLDGSEVCGTNFAIVGTTDDPSGSIQASYLDTNGNTLVVEALIERDGTFWVEGLPLHSGGNSFTLTAKDIWGNSSVTNLAVTQSTLVITLDAIDPNLLYGASVPVTGTVSDPTCSVWVNGVKGTNNGDGTWAASEVPVTPGGTACFYLSTAPPGNPPPASANVLDEAPKLPRTYIASYTADFNGELDITNQYAGGDWSLEKDTDYSDLKWAYLTAGNAGDFGYQVVWSDNYSSPGSGTYGCDNAQTWGASTDDNLPNGTLVDNPSGCSDLLPAPPALLNEHMDYHYSKSTFGIYGGTVIQETASHAKMKGITKVSLFTGGKAGIKRQTIWKLSASAVRCQPALGILYNQEIYEGENPVTNGIDATQIKMGELGQLDADGLLYVTLPNNVTRDITPTVSGLDWYEFSYSKAVPYPLVTSVHCIAAGDPNWARTTLGVGEQTTLTDNLAETTWTTTAGAVVPASGGQVTFVAPSNATIATVTATVRKASATIDYNVLEPTGVAASINYVFSSYPPGQAAAGMQLNVVLQPTTVSFSQLQMEEIGLDATSVTGYFTTHPPPSHKGNGADVWHPIGCDNQIGDQMDQVASFGWPSPWSNGSYTWPIPAVWRVGDSGPTNRLNWSDQVHTIGPDGTVTVEKFGHSVTRTTSGVITTQ